LDQILEVTTVAEASSPAMTVRDVAGYLNVNEKTVYRLAQRGELPGFKVAGAWRFQQGDLDDWISARKQAASGASAPEPKSSREVQRPRAKGSSATTGGAR
jgi:excisionase family DNA binding protein